MAYPNDEWQRKGATLSDKTARQEFGLTQDEIYDAIDAGTLRYRQAHMHGNPWLRLLRREVEALARPGTATVTSATAGEGGADARSARSAPADRAAELEERRACSAPIPESKRPGVVCRKSCAPGGRTSGRASVNSQARDAASRKTTNAGESAG